MCPISTKPEVRHLIEDTVEAAIRRPVKRGEAGLKRKLTR
jgi:hypothetical protein